MLPTLENITAKLDELLRQQADQRPRFLSVDRAADYCSISAKSIRYLISAGKLKPLRPVKGRVVIDRAALDSYVLSSNQQPRKGRGLRNSKP